MRERERERIRKRKRPRQRLHKIGQRESADSIPGLSRLKVKISPTLIVPVF